MDSERLSEDGQAGPSKRGRAMSLSVDWDNIVKYNQAKLKAGDFLKYRQYDRPIEYFCTGSAYTGKWNSLGMSGYGTYVFPHGVEYEGYMEDGMFHGEGTLSYPMGQKIEAVWIKGKLISFKFRYPDGLTYEEPWYYCKMPDRRFFVDLQEGMQPAGKEFLTNDQPTRPIDEGCYDTGDGFFNPKTKCVTSALDPEKVIRKIDDSLFLPHDLDMSTKFLSIPTRKEEQWIIENCRKAWDESAGYRPEFYEDWTTGRIDEVEQLQNKYTDADDETKYSAIVDFSELTKKPSRGTSIDYAERPKFSSQDLSTASDPTIHGALQRSSQDCRITRSGNSLDRKE